MCLAVGGRGNANEGNKKVYNKHHEPGDGAKTNETADVVQSQSYNAHRDEETDEIGWHIGDTRRGRYTFCKHHLNCLRRRRPTVFICLTSGQMGREL